MFHPTEGVRVMSVSEMHAMLAASEMASNRFHQIHRALARPLGRLVDVMLTDGTVVRVQFVIPTAEDDKPDLFTNRTYAAEISLLFEVRANVQCIAGSRQEADRQIRSVIKGGARPKPNFHVTFNEDSINRLYTRVTDAIHHHTPSDLCPEQLLIHNIDELRFLEREPLTRDRVGPVPSWRTEAEEG